MSENFDFNIDNYSTDNLISFFRLNNNYDFIFFYRPLFIKEYNFIIASKISIYFIYNNDDPFSKRYNSKFWNSYFKGVQYATHIFYYRNKNDLIYSGIP